MLKTLDLQKHSRQGPSKQGLILAETFVKKTRKMLSDARSHPKIRTVSIFHALLYLGVLGLGSLLALDPFLRTWGDGIVPEADSCPILP